MSVVVHFNTKKDNSGRNLQVVIVSSRVRGVLMLSAAEQNELLDTLTLGNKKLNKKNRRLPPGVKLFEADGTTPASLEPDEDGPPVCYMVDEDYICWEEDREEDEDEVEEAEESRSPVIA